LIVVRPCREPLLMPEDGFTTNYTCSDQLTNRSVDCGGTCRRSSEPLKPVFYVLAIYSHSILQFQQLQDGTGKRIVKNAGTLDFHDFFSFRLTKNSLLR